MALNQQDLDKYGLSIYKVNDPGGKIQVDGGPAKEYAGTSRYMLAERGGNNMAQGLRSITGNIDPNMLSGLKVQEINSADYGPAGLTAEVWKNQFGVSGANTSKANLDFGGIEGLIGQYRQNEIGNTPAPIVQNNQAPAPDVAPNDIPRYRDASGNLVYGTQPENATYSAAVNPQQPAQAQQTSQYYTPDELRAKFNYKIPGIADAVKVPGNLANQQFINAIFKEQFGRSATANELSKFGQMTVKDAANIVLRERSPFIATGTAKPDFSVQPTSTYNAAVLGSAPSLADQKSKLSMAADSALTTQDLEVNSLLEKQAALRAQAQAALEKSQGEKDIENQILEVRKQINDTSLNATAGLNKIDDQTIPMEFIVGQGAGLQKQANLKLQTLQANEQNLNARLGLAQDDRKIKLQGIQGLMEYTRQDIDLAMKQREMIQKREDSAFDRAMKLQDSSKNTLAMILDKFKGLDLEDLPDATRNQLADLSTRAGIPFQTLVAGMSVVKDQILYDRNMTERQLVAQQANDAFEKQYRVEQLRAAQQGFELDVAKFNADLQGTSGAGSSGGKVINVNGKDYVLGADGSLQSPQTPVDQAEVSKIDDALDLVASLKTDKGLSGAVGAKGPSSLFGILKSPIPGTKASDFVAKLDTLKSKLSLENRQLLKGTGQISDAEQKMLADASATLKTSMSEAEFMKQLNIVENIFKNAKNVALRRTGSTATGGTPLGKTKVGNDTYAVASIKNQITARYPDGYKGGQCGDFAHKIVDFPPVGDSKLSKLQAVAKHGIMADEWKHSPQVGDVIITGENPTYGHVAVVNAIYPDGRIQLTESNYKQSNRVSNDRIISVNNPKIYGAIRGRSNLS